MLYTVISIINPQALNIKIIKTKKVQTKRKNSLNKLSLLILDFVFVLILSNPAYAMANVQNTYTNIYMPASNLTDVSHEVTINNVPNLGSADFFWSDNLYFNGAPSNGTAYFGIQGINRALFSVFDYPSTEASSNCTVQQSGFDGGVYAYGGTSCIINYTITQGHTYLLTVTDVGRDSQGINWQASVEDLTTGITTNIATVNIATSWGTLTSTQDAWTEWFGPVPASCSALPYSNVTFSNFTANNDQYSTPSSHIDTLQTGTGCSGYSQIVDTSNNSFNQIMGINPPITNTIVPYSPPVTPPPITTTTIPTSTGTLDPTKSISKSSTTTSNIKTSSMVKKPNRNLNKSYIVGGIILIIIILGSVLIARFILRKKKLALLSNYYDLRSSPKKFVPDNSVESKPTIENNSTSSTTPVSLQPIIANPINETLEPPKD